MNSRYNEIIQIITVIKCDYRGEETWRYQGQILERGSHYIRLQAYFDHPDASYHGMVLCNGDRFVETYFDDKWYNIYEVHDRRDDHLKGWYCNISYPATFEEHVISYRDLALDLLVFPDGRQVVIDENEFVSLPLSPQDRLKAYSALQELKTIFRNNQIDPNKNETKGYF